MIGIVYKSTGSFYLVKDEDGKMWNCRMRGRIKTDQQISSTNPIAVGDKVIFEIDEHHNDYAIITHIQERVNYMVRVSPHNKHQKHIVASNIDQAVLIATIKEPRTSIGFIDRFLITAEAYHIPAIIVFNKADIIVGKSLEDWENKKTIYESVGYPVFTLSALYDEQLIEFEKNLQGKKSLISGHSGVGKSTLINRFVKDKNLKVQEISSWSGKGQHTTTFAEMMDLPNGGSIIDTPGVKEFGVVDISKEELTHFYPEMSKLIHQCKFNNCMHLNEPDCAVKEALLNGKLHLERYESYLAILDSL